MLMRFGYEETSLVQPACAREAVDSTAGQYSVMLLTARILLVQKADAAAFVWTLTGIKVCSPHGGGGEGVHLTIRPIARKGYGSIAHEAKPKGLYTRSP